jgi:RHS repeat-associated protein
MLFTLRCSTVLLSSGLNQESSGNSQFASLARINLKSSANKYLALMYILCALAGTAWSQAVIPQGITQWSTQIKAGPLSIDMATGNMLVITPVRKKAGAIPFSFDLIDNMNNQGAVNGNNGFIFMGNSGNMTTFNGPNPTLCGPVGQQSHSYAAGLSLLWSVSDGTGADHPFRIVPPIIVGPNLSGCGGTWGPVTAVALDGSGYTGVVTGSSDPNGQLTMVVYDKHGRSYTGGMFGLGTVKDSDGNIVSAALNGGAWTWTDTLGQPAVNLASNQYYYTDANGTDQYYTVASTSQHVKTLFSCAAPYGDMDTTMNLPSTITTPTGAKYTFAYELTGTGYGSDVTGRLSKVTLPSGGSFSFSYANYGSGGVNGFNCTSRVIPQLQITENDNNGHISTTTYQNNSTADWQQGYGPSTFTVIETDQLGDVTTHYFSSEQETERIISDVHLGVLSTTITCYNGNFTNCPTTVIPLNQGVVRITQTDVYTQLGSSGPWSLAETAFDNYGNTTSVSHWDWGLTVPNNGAPTAAPTTKTTTTYDGSSGSCGTLSNPYMYDRPCSVTTVNSSTATVAQTNYTYNSTGHPTQTSKWVSGTTYLTSSASFNTNGTLHTTTDPNTAITTLNYDGSCNSIEPTSTTFPAVNGVTMTTSQTWDCNGGVVTSTTDANTPGNVTHFHYTDPLWRQTEIDYPDGGVAKTTYNDTASPPNIQTNRLMDSSGHSVTTQTNYDGLNRPIQKWLTSDPNGTVHTDTTYDVLGRVTSVSNPYYTTGDATYGITQYTYDALDRGLTVTDPDGSQRLISYSGSWTEIQDEGNGTNRVSRIYYHDGLGRLVTVCEVSSASQQGGGSPTSCGAFSANGYLSTYGYSAVSNLTTVTQGSQTRTYGYDGLSRLTSASNPEASFGTTYTYDASGQQGDLYQRIAPAPNQTLSATVTTTYQHDALHRLVSKSYTDGTTPGAFYYYDQTAPWGTTLTNYMGRLTTEGTNNGSWITSAEYSYDSMGRALLNAQSVPTQYNLNYTYDYLGDWATSTNGMGTTLTYGYNQAGELTNLGSSLNDANHPPTLFVGTLGSYNALGSLASDTLGNGSETLTYDKRGRLSTVATIGPDQGNNTPGKGVVVVGGAEQSFQTNNTATGTVQITEPYGGDDSRYVCVKVNICNWVYDTGTVTITVNGANYVYTYGKSDTNLTVASGLTNLLNAGSFVDASYDSTGKITLAAEQTGSCCNYSLSTASSTNDPSYFSGTSFPAAPSGSSLSGGTTTTTYDTGTVSVAVGGIVETVNYGQSDTPTTIASNLTAKFNTDPSSVATGSSSGGTLNLTSKATGSGSNYSLSASTTWNSAQFSTASFTTTPSGADLTGGTNGQGNIYNLSLGYAPNSNIASANDTVNGNWTYGYDDFNRLTSANGAQNYTFAYDRYGNRWQENPGPGPQYSFTGNNNRIDPSSGVTYDAPGNVTNDSLGHTYFYDAENRVVQVGGTQGQCSTATACYIYDAEGRRAGKTLGASTVYYLYDLGGKEVAEVSSGGVWNRGEVYAKNRHLATYSGGSTGVTYFNTADWLGTERIRTGLTSIIETCTSLPFGDGFNCTGSDVSPMHFTGKQRDTESGDDYFGARYYSSTEGRFMSLDPLGGDSKDPQSLNRYAYVRNNPVTLTDPTGRNFGLACQGETGSCHNGLQGSYQWNSDQGTFVFTNVSIGNQNGQLQDVSSNKTGAYTGSFDGKNVSLTNSSKVTQNGSWIQGTDPVKGVSGGGSLGDKFSFDFYDHGEHQTFNFKWTYGGTASEAGKALTNAQFEEWSWGIHEGNEYRLPAQPSGARNGVHFIIDQAPDPGATTPKAGGEGHSGEYNPGVKHTFCDWMGLC